MQAYSEYCIWQTKSTSRTCCLLFVILRCREACLLADGNCLCELNPRQGRHRQRIRFSTTRPLKRKLLSLAVQSIKKLGSAVVLQIQDPCLRVVVERPASKDIILRHCWTVFETCDDMQLEVQPVFSVVHSTDP